MPARITAKQRRARVRNIAIARSYKKKSQKLSPKKWATKAAAVQNQINKAVRSLKASGKWPKNYKSSKGKYRITASSGR